MNKNKIYKKIIYKLRHQAGEFGPKDRAKFANFIKTESKVLGVKTPENRQTAKELSKEISDYGGTEILELADCLWQKDIWDLRRIVAFTLYNLRNRIYVDQLIVYLDKWINDIDNWETCDCLAMNTGRVIFYTSTRTKFGGKAKIKNNSSRRTRTIITVENLLDKFILKWSKSKNRWRRRFATVMLISPYMTHKKRIQL